MMTIIYIWARVHPSMLHSQSQTGKWLELNTYYKLKCSYFPCFFFFAISLFIYLMVFIFITEQNRIDPSALIPSHLDYWFSLRCMYFLSSNWLMLKTLSLSLSLSLWINIFLEECIKAIFFPYKMWVVFFWKIGNV